MINKRLINTGVEAAAAFDPLQNFETVTYTGNGGTQKITGYIRKGAAFNGSSSGITTQLGNSQLPVSSAWSCSCWINSANFTNAKNIIGIEDAGSPYNGWSLYQNTSGGLYPMIDGNVVGTAKTLTANQWYNVILTYNGTVLKFYVDGTQIGSDITTSISTPSSNFDIGNLGIYNVYDGKVDQVRLFNTALNQTQIDQLAAEDYTKATKSTTDIFGDGSGVALYELDDSANDTGRFGRGVIDSGQSIQGFSVSNYAVFAPTGNFASNSTDGDGSISLWYNLNSIPSNGSYYTLIGKGNPTTGSTYQSLELNLFGTPNSNEIEFHFRRGFSGTNYDPTSYTSARVGALAGVWYNLVLTYASSTKTVTFYVNDNLVGSYSLTSSVGGRTIDSGFNIGIYRTDAAQAFNGKLDEFRLYSDIVTSTEIGYLLSNDTVNIPTGNLEAYYKFDGNITDSSGNGNNGTLTGTLTYTTPAEFPTYNGTATNVNFLGMAFQPDLVWLKDRSAAGQHGLFDSVRGANLWLHSETTSAETDYSGNYGVLSFDSNGFSIGNGSAINTNGNNYVAWCFKGGGTAVSNTDGSITSTVSANQDAGFSIVKYSGTASVGATVGHGLSSAPEMFIIKETTNVDDWVVAVNISGTWYRGKLNTTDAFSSSMSGITNNVDPTSTIITLGNSGSANASGEDYIAYCFHSVNGYQKVGSYDGGTLSSSNIENVGFRPRFVMLKQYEVSGNNWVIYDTVRDATNPHSNILYPNLSDQEAISTNDNFNLYITDNGFYFNNTVGYLNNTASGDVIYLAIA